MTRKTGSGSWPRRDFAAARGPRSSCDLVRRCAQRRRRRRISPPCAAVHRRLAVFTVSPMTVYSRRRSEPMYAGERLAVVDPDADLQVAAGPARASSR